jgi:23S rRNA pseudouridine1911/1915/1917 synthase
MTLRCRVPAAADGCALAEWLAARFRYHDGEAWRAEIAAGRVSRNGAPAQAAARLAAGDEIAYAPAPAPPRQGPPVAIVHDEAAFVVIDKPAGLVAHASGAFPQHTFLAELERRLGAPLLLVHRLDRETSGLLLLAKDAASNAALQALFAAAAMHKHYLAVVHGVVRDDRFTIDAPIGPAAHSTIAVRRAVVAAGTKHARPACTEVEVLERFASHTLLRLVPRTGRTHQLRVHLEHAGHPLVGDKLYGRSDAEYLDYVRHLKAGGDPAWDHRLGAGRQLLHAAALRFVPPGSADELALEAALPADFAAFLAAQRG